MVPAINRKPWDGGCLIFAFPNKSYNALCKGGTYFLGTREELLLSRISGYDRHLVLLSSTCLGVGKAIVAT